MDKIRENTLKSLEVDFKPRGKNCNCWDRVRYSLPCPCIISRHRDGIPLEIIDPRWRFDPDSGKYKILDICVLTAVLQIRF